MKKYHLNALISADNETLKYFGYDMWMNSSREWMFRPGGSNGIGLYNFCFLPFNQQPIYILDSTSLAFLEVKYDKNILAYGYFTDFKNKRNKSINDIEKKINNVFENYFFMDYISAFEFLIKKNNLDQSNIGIEKDILPSDVLKTIESKFKRCNFVNATEIFRNLRMYKTTGELSIIKKCTEITENSLIKSIKKIKPGLILGTFIDSFKKQLEEKTAFFEHLVIFPKGLGVISSKDYIIENNSVIGIDAGAIYKNYISDVGFTIFLGKFNVIDLEIYKKIREILNAGFEKVKPGIKCSEIYQAMMKKQNYYKIGSILFEGHGIGISFREYPIINNNLKYSYYDGIDKRDADFLIEEGMVFNLEISYFVYNEKSFHIEETIYVKKNGFEKISYYDRIDPILVS